MRAPGRRALVLAGRGRYEDPWHDTAATSHEVATALGEVGVDAEVRGTFAAAFNDLDAFDLLVVNACSARPAPDAEIDGDDGAWDGAFAALGAWASSGGRLLALHQAANAFQDRPAWADVWHGTLGGSWVPGRSMHPERGPGRFDVVDAGHPVTRGLAGPDARFTADDERYSYLVVAPAARVLVTQRHEDVEHPVVWTHDAHGGLTVYDALGHDARAYREPVRRRLLQREALWLLGRDVSGS
ncbi:hypothetical protein GCM10023221_15740 [Luteimicrobium xylanilyticum]|uniref:ThuA-like domain-containing protein n=1 Tax=Luteimicrobium xylanilyticum TaxID=1133546 RepID=A0A5P9QGM0_9MICO|nr:ThuA domain-containing protein [Luteimicrobium xylanilyticum]QFV00171.1 hypothetical protein KDY119_03706 [Luteimicrobium xylanilyticum]